MRRGRSRSRENGENCDGHAGALRVEVHLPNGSGSSVTRPPECLVRDLKAAAQQHFWRRFLRLAAGSRELSLTQTLHQAGVRSGDRIEAIPGHVQLAATKGAFA
ncbi:unnamed protein product, partial [Effrenium voratum]